MQKDRRVIASTDHLRLVDQQGWSHVERTRATGVVCIASRTNEDKFLLVEQFRPPVNANVIELPAGLAGDEKEFSNESLEQAAKRELLEETGYTASEFRVVAALASSAGLTNEVVTLLVATGLDKIEKGGGVGNEKITVHEVPMNEANHWLACEQANGKLVDGRVYAGLHFLLNA